MVEIEMEMLKLQNRNLISVRLHHQVQLVDITLTYHLKQWFLTFTTPGTLFLQIGWGPSPVQSAEKVHDERANNIMIKRIRC